METLAPAATGTPQRVLTVTEVNRLVRGLLESEPLLRNLWVRGETSNVRPSPAGHLFFTLKDEGAQLACVFFGYSRTSRQALVDGVEIYACGELTVYEQRGQYQLVVRDLLLRGEGELAARYEKLRRALAEEGLFEEAHKLPLPRFPRVVGVVTSPQAAAFRDVTNVLSRRAPYLRLLLFPAAVQGEEAVGQLLSALQKADRCGQCEVILLVRGGGSLEDLWCFNDEALARALFKLKTPVVTGIGHETDFTIADFVADVRAPTPSAAAELVAPDAATLKANLAAAGNALVSLAQRRLGTLERGLAASRYQRLPSMTGRVLAGWERALADAGVVLRRAVRQQIARCAERTQASAERLSPRRMLRTVHDLMRIVDERGERLMEAGWRGLQERGKRLELVRAALAAADPQAALRRGFALLWDAERRRLITRVAGAEPGRSLVAELADGYIAATVERTEEKEDGRL